MKTWFLKEWNGPEASSRNVFRAAAVALVLIPLGSLIGHVFGGPGEYYAEGQQEGRSQGELWPPNQPLDLIAIDRVCAIQAGNRDLPGGDRDDFITGCTDAFYNAMPASSRLATGSSGADPSPSTSLAAPAPAPPAASTDSVPDLSLGCETILVRVAPRLLRDPNGVLQELAATYGRAGDLVIDAAFNYSDDPRLDTDPEAVAREACRG